MQTLWQDLRFGVRMLKKNPGFTAVSVLTLAVAIGANVVVFSAVNGLILRPLNVPHADSLFMVRIPIIWTCAIATAALMAWLLITPLRPGWTLAKMRHAFGFMK
jgi:hypothetical protein